MDSSYTQTSSDLPTIQAVNTVLFIVLIVVAIIAIVTIVKFSKHKPGMKVSPYKAKFVELEKDFRWRRLKVVYLIVSVLIVFAVIGMTYGEDMRAPLQTYQDFQEERAMDRMGTAFSAIVATLVLWGGYFVALPLIHRLVAGTKTYLSDPGATKK